MDQVKLCGSLKWMLDPPILTQDTTFERHYLRPPPHLPFFPPLSRYSSAGLIEKRKDLAHYSVTRCLPLKAWLRPQLEQSIVVSY